MNPGAYHLQQLMQYYTDREEAYRLILKFNAKQQTEYNRLYAKFVDANSNKSTPSKLKGESLEKLVEYIFNISPLFSVINNLRTTTNEVDLLVNSTPMGKAFIDEGFLDFPLPFLCECKNYNKKVGVTWIGKFFSLLSTSNKKFGIMFSYHGISGKNWSSANGLTKKINLSTNKETIIIDFSLKDFEEIKNGEAFINIINRKIFQLINDTSYICEPHELNGKFI